LKASTEDIQDMLKITINKTAYLCPTKPQEATLAFYERVYLALPEAKTVEEQCAVLIGCKPDEVAEADGALSEKLLGYLATTAGWLSEWATGLKEAKAKPITIGGTTYPIPKNWIMHQFRAHIQLTEWLEKGNANLVSNVVSLYLAPVVFGNDWQDDDREALQKELLLCRASETVPLFFYALSKQNYSQGLGVRALAFRLLKWTLAKRMRLAS